MPGSDRPRLVTPDRNSPHHDVILRTHAIRQRPVEAAAKRVIPLPLLLYGRSHRIWWIKGSQISMN